MTAKFSQTMKDMLMTPSFRNTRLALITGLLPFALPQLAAAQTVTLDPGLYDFTTDISIMGHHVKTETYEYCFYQGKNSKTFDEIASDVAGGGHCTLSNSILTASTGSTDVQCTDPDLGLKIKGRLEATYGSDYYNVKGTANIGGFQDITTDTKVKRRSDCPADWTNPDDVSAD